MGDCRAIDLAILREEISFAISFRGKKLGRINLKIPGKHNVYNILGALSVALLLEVPFDEIRELAGSFRLPPMRLETHNLNNGVILINDAYNANPFSMKEAIDYLSRFKGRKIAVLGDMLELGENAVQYHIDILKYALKLHFDRIFTFGSLFGAAAKALASPQIIPFDDINRLIKIFLKQLTENGTILVKGSRGMRMERVVNSIKRNIK